MTVSQSRAVCSSSCRCSLQATTCGSRVITRKALISTKIPPAIANGGFDSNLLGGFFHVDHDAIALGVPGSATGAYTLQKSRGFSVAAAINHYFTPNFHDVLFGSYEESSYGRAKNIDWTLGGLGDASQYRVGNQFLWDPVKNLEIGLEVFYAHLDQTLAHAPGTAATALPVGIAKNPDAFEGRLRLERDF